MSVGVADALDLACPPSGTACTVDFALITGIAYPDNSGSSGNGLQDGNIEIIIGDSFFENGTMRDTLIELAAKTANQSMSNPDVCFEIESQTFPGRGQPSVTKKYQVCNMAGGMLLEYYSGTNPDGPSDRLWLNFAFEGYDGNGKGDVTAAACSGAMSAEGFIAAVTSVLYPPLTVVFKFAKTIIQTSCKIAEDAEKYGDEAAEAAVVAASVLAGPST